MTLSRATPSLISKIERSEIEEVEGAMLLSATSKPVRAAWLRSFHKMLLNYRSFFHKLYGSFFTLALI
jgi:hypothetical protein